MQTYSSLTHRQGRECSGSDVFRKNSVRMQYTARSFCRKSPNLSLFLKDRGSHDYTSMTGVKGFVYCPHEFSGFQIHQFRANAKRHWSIRSVGIKIYEKHSVCTRLLIQGAQEVFGEIGGGGYPGRTKESSHVGRRKANCFKNSLLRQFLMKNVIDVIQ